MHTSSSSRSAIDRWLLQALVAGAAISLLLPFAQVNTAVFGWLPLWLVGLPLTAWLGWRGLSRMGTMPASVATVARSRRRIANAALRARRIARPMAVATTVRRPHARA